MTDDDPLEDLVVEAEEAREQYTEAQETLSEVKETLRDLTDDLHDKGVLSYSDAEEVHALIERGDYGAARGRLQEAREAERLEFSDDEKDLFARRFADAYERHEATVEQVRTALVEFADGLDREDLATYLYGKHSSLRKRDIEATLDAFDSVERQGLDARQMARILASYERELRIEAATDVIEAIQEEANE